MKDEEGVDSRGQGFEEISDCGLGGRGRGATVGHCSFVISRSSGYIIHSGLSSFVSDCFVSSARQSNQISQGEPLLFCTPFTHL